MEDDLPVSDTPSALQHAPFSSLVKDSHLPLLLDLGNGSKTLVVAFAGLFGGIGVHPFEFFNIIHPFDTDRIFIRDLSQCWYLQGLKGLTTSLAETSQLLKEWLNQYQYDNVVFVGNSMGGYAAIAHGVLAGADVILSFAPQTFLNAAQLKQCGDNRWPRHFASIPLPDDECLLDLKLLLNSVTYKSKIHLFYASAERIDKVHAEHIHSGKNVELHDCVEGGHHLVHNMKKSGLLYRVLRNSLSNSVEDRLINVWKDQDDIGTEAALERHSIRAEVFCAYTERHQDLVSAQQALLHRFFAALDSYIPIHFKLVCVNDRAPRHLCHNSEYCRLWFTSRKKEFFGSFFILPDRRFLLHVEVASKNLHIGIVRCQLNSSNQYTIIPMQEEEFAEVLQAHSTNTQDLPMLARRNWGPRWCSVDCGKFDNPETFGTYKAMSDFEHSSLCHRTFTPFIKQIKMRWNIAYNDD